MILNLRQEVPDDWWEVEALLDLCFAPGRTALSSYRLRDGVDPVAELCLVAHEEGVIAGAIRVWPVRVAGEPVALIGPVAVHPTHQGEGLGGMMIRESLRLAGQGGWKRLMLVGDAPYYGRFGFRQLDGVVMPPPTNPERVLGLGDWTGITGQVLSVREDGSRDVSGEG